MAAFFPLSRIRPVVLAALGVALAAGSTGCVSMDEHKRLQAAFDQARQQLAEAENDLANMRKRIGELEAQIAQKDALLNNSTSGVGALKRERDLLAQQLADLQKKYDELLALSQKSPELPTVVVNRLEELAAKYPDLLEFDPKLGMVRFKSDLTFDLGSTEVKPRAKEALRALAGILNDPLIAGNEIRVVGHTDDVPIRGTNPMNPTNWHLSTNRAHSVLRELRTDGVAESRGQAAGWGEQRPIAENNPGKRGNERNRRVEIYILPTKVPDNLVISTPGAAAPVHRTPTPRRSTTPVRSTSPAPTTAPSERTVPVPIPG